MVIFLRPYFPKQLLRYFVTILIVIDEVVDIDINFVLLQLTITSSQMQWTSDCTKALASTKERGDKKALKSLKKKQARTV